MHNLRQNYINNEQYFEFTSESGLVLFSMLNGKQKSKYIGNFWPEVVAKVMDNQDNDSILYVKLILRFTDGTSSKIITELRALEKADWPNDIDLRCVLNPDFPKANKHLANLIRLLCRDVPEEKISVIGHFGAYFVGKNLFSTTGIG